VKQFKDSMIKQEIPSFQGLEDNNPNISNFIKRLNFSDMTSDQIDNQNLANQSNITYQTNILNKLNKLNEISSFNTERISININNNIIDIEEIKVTQPISNNNNISTNTIVENGGNSNKFEESDFNFTTNGINGTNVNGIHECVEKIILRKLPNKKYSIISIETKK